MSLEAEVRHLSDLFEFYLKEAYGYEKPEGILDEEPPMDIESMAFKFNERKKLMHSWQSKKANDSND